MNLTEKTLAVIITYNPDTALLGRAVEAVAAGLPSVLIMDNGSENEPEVRSLAANRLVEYISNRSNLGSAGALNRSFEYALSQGYEWVLTLDQDSVLPAGFVLPYSELVARSEDKLSVVCCNFIDRSTGRVEFPFSSMPRDVDQCITSGSLNRASDWALVDGFDESMFIDGVDFDYCRRIRDAGKRIVLVPDVLLEHGVGSSTSRRFLWWKVNVQNHSAFRKFYISQNIIYLSGKYSSKKAPPKAYAKVLKQVLLVALFERGKQEKIVSIFRGVGSGRRLLRDLCEGGSVPAGGTGLTGE